MSETATRTCPCCHATKPLTAEFFAPSRHGRSGQFSRQCLHCIARKKSKRALSDVVRAIHDEIGDMVVAGASLEQISERYPAISHRRITSLMSSRRDIYADAIRAGYPKLSYIRDADGQRMWEVFEGHVIGESSLAAFGFSLSHREKAA